MSSRRTSLLRKALRPESSCATPGPSTHGLRSTVAWRFRGLKAPSVRRNSTVCEAWMSGRHERRCGYVARVLHASRALRPTTSCGAQQERHDARSQGTVGWGEEGAGSSTSGMGRSFALGYLQECAPLRVGAICNGVLL